MSSAEGIIIETPRLILRPWKKNKADAKALYQLAKDARIGPAAGWRVHRDPSHSLQIIRDILSTAEIYAVFRSAAQDPGAFSHEKTAGSKQSSAGSHVITAGTDKEQPAGGVKKQTPGPLVGAAGITYGRTGRKWLGSHEAEIGYWIGVPYWGNGYAPEAVRALLRRAFEELGMERVWCGYYDGNEQSRRVQEKCGFVYDHTDWHAFNEELDEERAEHFCVLTKSRYEALQ